MTLLDSMMSKWQTPCTPNVLGIYLLMRVMKDVDPIRKTEENSGTGLTSGQHFSKGISHFIIS